MSNLDFNAESWRARVRQAYADTLCAKCRGGYLAAKPGEIFSICSECMDTERDRSVMVGAMYAERAVSPPHVDPALARIWSDVYRYHAEGYAPAECYNARDCADAAVASARAALTDTEEAKAPAGLTESHDDWLDVSNRKIEVTAVQHLMEDGTVRREPRGTVTKRYPVPDGPDLTATEVMMAQEDAARKKWMDAAAPKPCPRCVGDDAADHAPGCPVGAVERVLYKDIEPTLGMRLRGIDARLVALERASIQRDPDVFMRLNQLRRGLEAIQRRLATMEESHPAIDAMFDQAIKDVNGGRDLLARLAALTERIGWIEERIKDHDAKWAKQEKIDTEAPIGSHRWRIDRLFERVFALEAQQDQ